MRDHDFLNSKYKSPKLNYIVEDLFLIIFNVVSTVVLNIPQVKFKAIDITWDLESSALECSNSPTARSFSTG